MYNYYLFLFLDCGTKRPEKKRKALSSKSKTCKKSKKKGNLNNLLINNLY